MMKCPTNLKLLISTLLITTANAQEVTREEFENLLNRVQILEQKLEQTHKKEVEAIATNVTTRAESSEKTEKESELIENVITVIQTREESVTFPWMSLEKWATIEKGMPVEKVLEILGKPYTNEPSLRNRIDYVFTYTGRRVATNKKVKGIVRFYKDQVIEIQQPNL